MTQDLDEVKKLLQLIKDRLEEQRRDSEALFNGLTRNINVLEYKIRELSSSKTAAASPVFTTPTKPPEPPRQPEEPKRTAPTPPQEKSPSFSGAQPVTRHQSSYEQPRQEPVRKTVVLPESEWEKTAREWRAKIKSYNWSQWEMLIGTNWLSRIGIIVIALGMIFFMKYSFDNNFISPSIRILMAILLGIAALGAGEYFNKKKMPSQVQVFLGGGVLILYAAIVMAKHYPFSSGVVLESNLMAIVFMVLVTAIAYVASLRYDSTVIAAIGLIGGFLTPIVVGKSSGRVAPLLLYLAILGAASFVLEYRKNWRKLFITTVFLTFLEPLVLSFNNSEQHALLFVYLLLLGIACIGMAAIKGWRTVFYTIFALVCVVPIIAYARTTGAVAHPAVIYSYCLFACGAAVGVAIFKGWKQIGLCALVAAYVMPLLLVNAHDELTQHLFWVIILPLLHSLILTTACFYLIANKRMDDYSKGVGIAGLVVPVLSFYKNFHVFFPPLGLWQLYSTTQHQTTWALSTYGFLVLFLVAAAVYLPRLLILVLPLTYFTLKMTVFPDLFFQYWPVLFGFGTFGTGLGLVMAHRIKSQSLALAAVLFGFLLPIATYVSIPAEIWLNMVLIYSLTLMTFGLIVSSLRGWKKEGITAIAAAFVLPIFCGDIFLVQPIVTYAYVLITLLTALYFAQKNREEFFAIAAFIGAWVLPLILRRQTLEMFFLPYAGALVLTTIGLLMAFFLRWKNVLMLTIIGWLCFPLLASHAGTAFPPWVCAYGIVSVVASLFVAHKIAAADLGIGALAAGYAFILSLYPVADSQVTLIYAYCIIVTLAGLAMSFLSAMPSLSFAAIAGGFLTPLWIFNLSQSGFKKILAYGVIMLCAGFGQSFFKRWRWLVSIPITLLVGASAYVIMLNGVLQHLPRGDLFFGYGVVIFLAVAILAYYKNWQNVLSFVAVMALCFGLASAFHAETIPYRHTYLLYILGINVLVFVLAHIKKWPQCKNAVFVMTLVMTSLVFIQAGKTHGITHAHALYYLTAFFGLYFTSTVVENIFSEQSFNTHDWIFMLATPTYYYGWLYKILKVTTPSLLGPAAIALGGLYVGLGMLILRKSRCLSIEDFKQSPRHTQLMVLFGIAATLLTLAIPIQLDPRLVTVAWALEAALLCWAGFRLGEFKVRWASYAIFLLTFIRYYRHDLDLGDGNRFITDVQGMSLYPAYQAFFSTRFVAGLFGVALTFWFAFLHNRHQKMNSKVSPAAALFLLGNGLIFWLLTTEVGVYLLLKTQSAADVHFRQLVYSMIWALHATVLLVLGLKYRNVGSRSLGLILFAVVFVKIFTNDIWAFNQAVRIVAFIILGILLIASGLFYTKYKKRLEEEKSS